MTFRTPATMFFIVMKETTTCTAEYEFCCPTLTTVCRLNELPVQKKKVITAKQKMNLTRRVGKKCVVSDILGKTPKNDVPDLNCEMCH